MSSSQQTQGDGSMQGSHLPNMSGESAIPASFFDIPIEYESTDGNINMDFASISGFPATDTPMPNAPDFDALTVQIAANMPPLDSFSTYPMASPSQMAQAPQPNPTNMAIKMELDDLSSIAPSPSIASEVSTSKPSSLKAKKPSKQKADGTETKPKPKKPKKKSTTGAATTDATAFSSSAQPSNVTAASTAPKPKKTSKNKASDKDKSKEEAHQQPTSTAASPAPFATPVSSSKESKPKAKKAGGSKVGTKAGSKARSSTARSASRKSSMGRDATTPAASRVDSQRPNDEANDDDEPASNVQAPPPEEDEEAEDEEADADDGVEELGRDHFSTQEAIYAAQQRNMGLLSMVMDEDQLDRHMASRRGALNKTNVRKLVNHVLSQSVSQHVAMVVSGVAKIFVGEIIETAREIQSIRREHGPLRPNHLREAHRQYYLKRERPGHYPPGTNTGHPGVGKRRRLF